MRESKYKNIKYTLLYIIVTVKLVIVYENNKIKNYKYYINNNCIYKIFFFLIKQTYNRYRLFQN